MATGQAAGSQTVGQTPSSRKTCEGIVLLDDEQTDVVEKAERDLLDFTTKLILRSKAEVKNDGEVAMIVAKAATDLVAWGISKTLIPSQPEFIARLPSFWDEMMHALPEEIDQHLADASTNDRYFGRLDGRGDLVEIICHEAGEIVDLYMAILYDREHPDDKPKVSREVAKAETKALADAIEKLEEQRLQRMNRTTVPFLDKLMQWLPTWDR